MEPKQFLFPVRVRGAGAGVAGLQVGRGLSWSFPHIPCQRGLGR